MEQRHAFYISDSTGLTAETLGNALLAQFDQVEFRRSYHPYTDTVEKAQKVVEKIDKAYAKDGVKPLIFDTILNQDLRIVISGSKGLLIDVIGTFLPALESELGALSAMRVGKSHANPLEEKSQRRMEAVNYALDADDGARTNRYDLADIILIGVSRSAKTPTCLYIAMQFGLYAANYPLTEEDLNIGKMPPKLLEFKEKLFGLTVEPKRLSTIRNERRADSKYASLSQCEWEVKEAQILFRNHGISSIDTTRLSVEEISTQIILMSGLKRNL
jgi:[pyruvate, water dikinase]-phosphate phosphotransferase / [pyruvate, water dikinase] kinase